MELEKNHHCSICNYSHIDWSTSVWKLRYYVGDQKLDEIIPPESVEKTLKSIQENTPIKMEKRPYHNLQNSLNSVCFYA